MELEDGKILSGLFVIEKISIKDNFIELVLNDGTTKISGILEDNIDTFSKNYGIGNKIFCKGKLRKKRKNFCLDLIYVSKNMLETNIEKRNVINVQNFIDRFNELVSSIIDVDYKNIIDNCFNDDVKDLFFSYPAAKSNHHNYAHGLVQHSIEVVDICLLLANYYKDINKDLLICSGLLHDIGKLKSYDFDNFKIVKTDWEELLGHLSISSLFISKITPPDIDQKKIMLLYHTILSHHGELNFGSPVVCKTREAYILNKADDISSTINRIDMLSYKDCWSEKDTTVLNRNWYKG